jgi:hypothetical protein
MAESISALTPFPGNYAYAVICVSNNEISNVFRVKDPSSSNPTFYVDASGFTQLIVSTDDISNSNLNYGTITFAESNKMNVSLGNAYIYGVSGFLDFNLDTSNIPYKVDNKTIKDDVLRNLANYLFNTQYGVKILTNHASIKSTMNTTINSLFTEGNPTNIYGILNNADNITVDLSSNSNIPITNIGYKIFDAIQTIYPERFSEQTLSLSTNPIDDGANNIYQMPFYPGDSIYMKLNINYPVGQGSIVGMPDPPGRNYQVRLLIL